MNEINSQVYLEEKTKIANINKLNRDLSLFEISKIVEKHTGYKLESLRSKERTRSLVYARAVFAIIATKRTKETYEVIGEYINRDHSTINHYLYNLSIFDEIFEITNKY